MIRFKVAYRWTRRSVTRWLRAIKVECSPLFRGKFAVGGIGLCVGFYCWVFSLNLYGAAEWIAVLTGIWCVLCWINSDYLAKKWRVIHGTKRKPENIPHFRFRYRVVKWLVVLFMLGATASFVHLAAKSRLEFEQDDVFNHLITEMHIPPGAEDEPTETEFTVRNGGRFTISGRHQLSCKVNAEILDNRPIVRDYSIYGFRTVGGKLFLLSRDPALPEVDTKITLQPNGDALSQDCLAWVNTKQMNCIDATIVFAYYLSSQPTVLKVKRWRWVAKQSLNGKALWVQQPLDGAAEGGCFVDYPG